MKEFELRKPVARWLLARGLSPVLECSSLRNCDIVGVRYDGKALVNMIAVELKLRRTADVLDQCKHHVDRVGETWAAMPLSRANEVAKHFRTGGIGLLGVTQDKGCVIVHPARVFDNRSFKRWQKTFHRRQHEYKRRMRHPLMFRFFKDADYPEPAPRPRIAGDWWKPR